MLSAFFRFFWSAKSASQTWNQLMLKGALFAGISIAAAVSACPASAATGAPDDSTLAEVIVTATRKEVSLQKVPVSVAVIDGAAIERSGSLVFGDIGFSTANFATNTSGHNPLIGVVTIRGISGHAGVYLDDVIIGSTAAYNSSLLDVERVEILRGPQGTTFGANTLAGAINTITKKPSLTTLQGQISGMLGSYGTEYFRGYVTGPIAEGVGVKLSAYSNKVDGPDKDVKGKRYNGNDEAGFRASVLYDPSDAVSVLLTYNHSRLSLRNAFVPELFSAPSGTPIDSLIKAGQLPDYRNPTDYRVFGTTDPNILNRDIDGFSGRVDWRVADIKLTSITAYRRAKSFTHKDEDYTPIYFGFSDTPQLQEQFTQEFRAVGSWKQVDYVGGLFYFNNRTADDSTIPLSGSYLNLVGLSPELFTSLGLPAALSTSGAVFSATRDTRKTESFAVFGSADVHLTEALKVTVGGRYTTETVDGSSGAAASNLPAPFLAFLPAFVYGTQARPASIPLVKYSSIKSSRVDPTVSVSYAVTSDINIYATAGSGYKSPGYNSLGNCTTPTVNAPCIVKRETGQNLEAGIKSEWFDHRLRVNLVAYILKLKDAQLFQTVPQAVGPNLSKIVNSDETSKGLELEFVAKPFQGLTLEGSLGYQDASYDSYPNAFIQFNKGGTAPGNCYAANINVANGFCIGDATGKTIPFAPKYTGGVAATYEGHITSNIDWFVRGEGQHRSKYGFQLGTATVTQVSNINLINLAAGVSQSGGRGFALTVRGRNVTNEHYFTNAANAPTGETFVNLNDPRTWTVELSYRY